MQQQYYTFNASKTGLVLSGDKNARNTIARVVDINSIVAIYILEDIVSNGDVGISSFYMTVDLSVTGDGRLLVQAAWDYDYALGNSIMTTYDDALHKVYAANAENRWLTLFYKADWFKVTMKKLWMEAKEYKIAERVLQYIQECIITYTDAYVRNFAKWQNIRHSIDEYFSILLNLAFDTEKRTLQIYNLYCSFGDLQSVMPAAARECATQAEAGRYLYTWLQERFTVIDSIYVKFE